MDIHRPKPVHSWREFASEILVIVVGITIALSGEQTLEWLHWRHEVAETRAALRKEVGIDLDSLDFIISEEPCIDRRLAEVGSALGVPGAPPLKRPLGQPQFPNMPSAAWDVARASGVVSHLPQEEASHYRSIYTELEWTKARIDEQRSDWATLSALDLGAPISPILQAELLPTLAHAKVVASKFAQNYPLVPGGDSAKTGFMGRHAAQVGVDRLRRQTPSLSSATIASRRVFCEAA
ncbi:hypothetical protein [Phenylobacterium aquaticum]|uniref:hypothetical protein n=1 Tax=Phenylobacterium aquaticum TaxID=1763816 RepID=UPI0026EA0AE6|nr:hypothetical protein [Phenylobacterium aquaticum]